MRKFLAKVVATVTVLVTAWALYFISGLIPPLLWNAGTLTNSTTERAWTGKVSESVIAVDVDGNFTDRIARFNIELRRLRRQLTISSPGNNVSKTTCRTSAGDSWTSNVGPGAGQLRVVSGAKDNYIDELSGNPDIITVVLPWLRSVSYTHLTLPTNREV